MVYHYTSTDALRLLIESVKNSKNKDCFVFRASNILYMNDPEEFIYGQKVFVDTLKEIESVLGIDNMHCISNEIHNYPIIEDTINGKKDVDVKELMHSLPYVISFSTLEDSLPMWLNYGNAGKGVCLAFQDNRDQPLRKRVTQDGEMIYESFYTSDVHYREINKDSWLYKTIFDIMKDYKKDVETGSYCDWKDSYYKVLVETAAPFIKTAYYENEKEVRVSKTIGYDFDKKHYAVEYRCNSNGNIIPYINIEIPVSQLDYVITGPLVNHNLTKIAIEMMTDSYLNKILDIRPSNVKYRKY